MNISPYVSTRGGIEIYLLDADFGTDGKGFIANVSLTGNYYCESWFEDPREDREKGRTQ